MTMVRKQLYLRPDQESKVRRLAAQRRCTEAEIVRAAIDLLVEEQDPILRRLDEVGIVPYRDDDLDDLTEEEEEALERELDEWALQHGPLGLSEAVIEDRR